MISTKNQKNYSNWMDLFHHTTQHSFQEALNMVLSRHVGHIEIYKKKIISERQRIFQAKEEAKINNIPESSISLKKYQILFTELYLLLDYVCDTPFTHPADSIIGVKKTQ